MSVHIASYPANVRQTVLVALAVFLSLGSPPVEAAAQVAPPAVGQQVRVHFGGQRIAYEFRGLRGDTLLLHGDDGALRVPLDLVNRIDVRTPIPRSRHLLRAFSVGAVSGGLLGFVVGAIAEGDCQGAYCGLGPALAGGAGVWVGGAVGLVVGLNTKSHRWTPVQPREPAGTVTPRAEIGLVVRWSP